MRADRARGDRSAQLEAARRAFYDGFVAEQVGRFCRTTEWPDTTGRRHGGLLTAQDLATWSATVETPTSYDYDRYTVFKTGPWGQGPVLLQQLALLAAVDLSATEFLSADYVHLVTECAKLAFADREAWYGEDAPHGLVDAVLAPAYVTERASLVGEHADLQLRPGAPQGVAPRLADHPTGIPPPGPQQGAGEPTVQADGVTAGDTCHIDVADRWGNLVSATPSGGWLHSSPYLPSLGFCLGTRAQMFWLEDGLPSSLRPRARPRTTLSPSLAFRDGDPWLAFGTPGGDQQDQWSLTFFLALVHGNLDLQSAIESPAFHSEHFPSSFYPRQAQPGRVVVESRLGESVIADLRHRGHQVGVDGPWSLGRLSAVAREVDRLVAAANPRGAQGYAVGR